MNTLQENGADEYWPYGGVRKIKETHSEEKWGKAHYTAMIIDAHFSLAPYPVGVLCHPELWYAFLKPLLTPGSIIPFWTERVIVNFNVKFASSVQGDYFAL